MTSADGWEFFDDALPFVGRRYGPQRARMVLVGLGGRDLLVVSPGSPMDAACWRRLAELGEPRFLLAPNHFHNMGIGAWTERFPDAVVVAHPRAIPRLRKKLPDTRLHDLGALERALPPTVRLLSPPGARQGETWVSVRTGTATAWMITDAIVNQRRLPGATGLLMRALGFRARLMANPLFMRFFLDDRAAYRRWFAEQLERENPTLFVPAHGSVLEGADVAARLASVLGG